MRTALAFLADHVVTVLLAAGLVALLLIAYLVFVLRRARREEAEEKENGGTEGAAPPGPVATMTGAASLEVSFRRALKTLRASTTGSEYRYRIPWYLMLGPSGSGKSALLEGLALPRRVQREPSSPAAATPCHWHFFDDGVLLDIAGGLVLNRDLSSDERGWRRLLHLLKRYRSERPIDGVVLTLSAADLLSWETRPAEEVRAIGTGLFDRLRQAQGELGVRFPVYVILTHADKLPGFSSFVEAVPRRFRQDVFGWSSPYALDVAFRAEWVDEALGGIESQLRDRSTEVLASRSVLLGADAVFRFPDVVPRLLPAARTILSEIFEESAYHEGFFLRGIYFSGRVDDARAADAAEAAAPAPGTGRAAELVFLGKLFQTKIFPERGLARAFGQGLLARNRVVRWLQVASAAVVLVGAPALWVAHGRLQRQARPLEQLLDSVGNNFGTMSASMTGSTSMRSHLTQMGREAVVFKLLEEMARLNSGPFRSVALPTSWFSDLDGHITKDITGGFQDVILPTMRIGTVQWADTMASERWATTIGDRVPLQDTTVVVTSDEKFQQYTVLIRYLSELRQFIDASEQFNRIARHSGDPIPLFSKFFVWYYEQSLPPAFFRHDQFYRKAMEGASETPVSAADWPGFEQAAARVETFLADRFYARLGQAMSGLQKDLDGTVDPSTFTAADLRQLWQNVGQVQDLLASTDSAWLDAGGPMPAALTLMLDSLPGNSVLFDKPEFVTRFTAGFQQVRRRRLARLSGELSTLSQAFVTDSGVPAVTGTAPRIALGPQLRSLRAALGDLMSQDFMAPLPPGQEQPPPALAGQPTWDMGPLAEALVYFRQYRSFQDSALTHIPPQLQGLVTQVAGRSLDRHVRWALQQAMTYRSSVEPEGTAGTEKDLEIQLQSFDQAARRFVSMLDIDASVGGTPAGRAVAETIILESSDLLGDLQDLLEQDGLYQPVNGSLAVWNGDGPASWAGFGVSSAKGLEQYLAQQRKTLTTLGRSASQILGYLELKPVAALLQSDGEQLVPGTEGLMAEWQGIVQALSAYGKKTPGNSLEALDRFIRRDMGISTLSECPTIARVKLGAPRDYFDSARASLDRMLRDRCTQLARLALRRGYERMRRFFSARLAGRFPFADLAHTPGAPDASPADVRTFLQMYDSVTGPLGGDVAGVAALLGGEVPAGFFHEVGEVRRFLGPVVLPDSEGVEGALTFRVALRTDRSAERGADQIVNWKLRVGNDSVVYLDPAAGTGGRWRLGDPVSVSLTWASGSPRRPVPDAARPDMSVDGTTVTWRYGGPWALLRLIAAHEPQPADLAGLPAGGRGTVNLRVLTRSRDAERSQGARSEVASVFLRLDFSSASHGGAIPVPRFPIRAPLAYSN